MSGPKSATENELQLQVALLEAKVAADRQLAEQLRDKNSLLEQKIDAFIDRRAVLLGGDFNKWEAEMRMIERVPADIANATDAERLDMEKRAAELRVQLEIAEKAVQVPPPRAPSLSQCG
jgi:hypothetical protein